MKITIEMQKYDWVAIEEVLRYGIQHEEDRVLRELLLEAYDKKKMLMPAPGKSMKLELLTAMTVAKYIDTFMGMVVGLPRTEHMAFLREYHGNLNRVANYIYQQTRTVRQ